MEKAQISAWQFFLLIFGYLVGTSSFFHPGGLIVVAKQDAWKSVPLWAGASGIVMFLIWIKLASYYPEFKADSDLYHGCWKGNRRADSVTVYMVLCASYRLCHSKSWRFHEANPHASYSNDGIPYHDSPHYLLCCYQRD